MSCSLFPPRPFSLPCGISSSPHPRSRDAVIRRERERKREWDDQTNTFFSRRGMDNRARSAEKSGGEGVRFVFLSFPALSSFLKIDTPPPPPRSPLGLALKRV